MKKAKWVQIVCATLSLVWMIVIFAFSAQDGVESAQTSDKVVNQVAPVVVPDYNHLSAPQKIEKKQELSFIVRKCAHYSEYALLGLLVSFALPFDRMKRRYTSLIAMGVCVLYAVSDEFHQNFSGGRSPAVRDVLIDSCGALTGVLIACLLLWLIYRRIAKKRSSETPAEDDEDEEERTPSA